MLAWVFWHTPATGVVEEDYHAAVRAFHDRIRELRPGGLIDVRLLRYRAVPWLPSSRDVYEDWYLLTSSAALDILDETAVSSHARDVHRRVATMAAEATAGLYRLRAGAPSPSPATCTWLNKMRTQSYDDFLRKAGAEHAVWCRQMVLGPTPEFCIEGAVGPPLVPSVTLHAEL